jgi:parvulin-like peptidyl-prolyl isomerase
MSTVMQLGNRVIQAEDIVPLLRSYQLLPQLIRESVIDEAIALIVCTPAETVEACERFYHHYQLTTEAERQQWLELHGMSPNDVAAIATRQMRIDLFKRRTWSLKIPSYFLSRKANLDRVIYSLICLQDREIAQELFFRIQNGEQSLAELAQTYSQGSEADTGGWVGPVELGILHPALGRLLYVSQPGVLHEPMPIENWWAIVRLEQRIPAILDETMEQRLLEELFQAWLQEQIERSPKSIKMLNDATH